MRTFEAGVCYAESQRPRGRLLHRLLIVYAHAHPRAY